MGFIKYIFGNPEKRFFFIVIFVMSLILCLGSVAEGSPIFGIIFMVIMNGVNLLGDYFNYTKRWR